MTLKLEMSIESKAQLRVSNSTAGLAKDFPSMMNYKYQANDHNKEFG